MCAAGVPLQVVRLVGQQYLLVIDLYLARKVYVIFEYLRAPMLPTMYCSLVLRDSLRLLHLYWLSNTPNTWFRVLKICIMYGCT